MENTTNNHIFLEIYASLVSNSVAKIVVDVLSLKNMVKNANVLKLRIE